MKKKSSIIYHDAFSIVNDMPDEMAGRFAKNLLILMHGDSVSTDNFAMKMALHPFKKQFDRDNEAYEKQCEKNRLNGSKGGRPRKNPKNPSGFSKTQKTQANPKNPDKDKDKDKDKDTANKIICYLNEQTGKSYRPVESNISLILARINEGYDEKDFFVAIDNQVKAWGDDEKMKQFLRPSTLFQKSKFDGYVNNGSLVNKDKKVGGYTFD